MAGGLRHTTAQIQELEATQSWILASGEALAYLIRNSPRPKDAREKQLRARILLALRNAMRAAKVRRSLAAPASVAPDPEVGKPEPVNKSTSPPVDKSTPDAPPAPTPLRVDIVVPAGPVPTPRPGTTAGEPFLLERSENAE